MFAAKEEAKKLIENVPDDATWDDIMYEFYVRQKVDTAIEEMEAGNVVPHEEIEQWLLSQ
jgi:predicted transcriptional regulator